MIQRNIWQRADPRPPWHPRVQEHGCEGSEEGLWWQPVRAAGLQRGSTIASWKIDLKIPLPSTHPRYTLYFWTNLLPGPTPLTPPRTQTHTPRSLHPRVNIISFSDRWEGSDLVENEATNLHPYYTVIHTQLQTCMRKLALLCTMLSRMTLTVTHLLSLHVKGELDGHTVSKK